VTLSITASDSITTSGTSDVLLTIGEHLFPGVCVSAVAMAAIYRWITNHETTTRADLAAIAEQRERFDFDVRAKTAQLAAREHRVNALAEAGQAQLTTALVHLEETRAALAAEQKARAALQAEFDELAADHNLVIQEALQDRADMFVRPHGSQAKRPPKTAPAGHPGPGVKVLRTSISPQPEPQADHARTVDQVGDM
jgi:hypothetical protein